MKIFIRLAWLIGLLFTSIANATVPVEVDGKTSSLAPMLQKIMPTIVNIVNQGEFAVTADPFLKRGMEQSKKYRKLFKKKPFMVVGSGVIIDAKQGYIVTNAHLVTSDKKLIVTLHDGRTYIAKKIGADESVDLAVIQIQADKLTEITTGDSSKLRIGDFVAAIGSPFGLKQSVSCGIVSALRRSNLDIEGIENFIQTDASMNVGNSGGAMVNINGELVGINTAIYTPPGAGSSGVGFAIPVNMVKSITSQLIEYGQVKRGIIGIIVQQLTPELAEALSANVQEGALISQVIPASPAEQIGLKSGDVIITINKEKITNSSDVHNIVSLTRVGGRVDLTVMRNGKPLDFSVNTVEQKEVEQQEGKETPYLQQIILRDSSEQVPNHGYVVGIRVDALDIYSSAATAGIRPGDMIIAANNKKVTNIKELTEVAKQSNKGLLLKVLRAGGALFVLIK